MRIEDIFLKDITRKINGVVKADQTDKDIIVTELSEYVVTEELKKHFDRFFDRYIKSFSSPTEDMGVWISGFYGSGKSHFLKMLGRILENKEYDGKSVSDYFKEKIEDEKLQSNIERSSEVPTDVILFNVDNVSDQDTYRNKDSIPVAFLKNFNGYFGFSKDNLKIANFERMLFEKGILDEYRENIEELVGKEWKDILRNLDFYQDEFIEVNEEMGIMSEESSERWLEKDDKISVSPESFADLLEAYLKTKEPNHRIVFLVDEIGQYIGNNSQLMLNLQTLVEILGVRFQGRVWVIVTSQQDLGSILGAGERRRNDFSKIQDRFKTMLSLSSSNIDEVIKKRLLEKGSTGKKEVEELYTKDYLNINNTINFNTNEVILPIYSNKNDFIETYPFVGYQFSLLQKVFEKVRDMGYSGQHMSRGERSLLSSFQEAGIRVKDNKLGSLVPFNYFFESIEQFLEDVAKRPFTIAKNERKIDEFELEVLKLLFLLKGINEVKSNIDNLVSFMIDSTDCDRIALEEKIKKALLKLEQQVLIQKDGDEYFFLTNEEQDINKEINQEQVDYEEVAKQLDSYIFGEIFSKPSILSDETKLKYSFTRRIDEFFTSKKGEQLDIRILTPYSEDYNNVLLIGIRDSENELIVKFPEDETTYIDEIKLYLKVEKYVRRKNIESTRDTVLSILSKKQKENNSRKKRIRAEIERVILKSEVYVYGQKKEIGNISDPSKFIETALKFDIEFRFKSAGLLKTLYDEARIRDVLSYSFNGANTLIQINRDLEGNINREAIKEIKKRVEFLEKIGKTVTLKELVEHFAKAPYGWNTLSVNGLVAELFVYKLIEISESKEVVKDGEKLKDYLTKLQAKNLERIVINLKEEVDTELIKKINNVLSELFGSNSIISLESPKADLIGILEKRRTTAFSHFNECNRGKYPGKKEVKNWYDLLDEILERKNDKTDKFLKEFLKYKDELRELYYHQSEVDDFFSAGSSKKIKFDSARAKINEIDENLGYLGGIKEKEPYRELLTITEASKPYSRIREIDDLLNQINVEENVILEYEKDILKEKGEKEKKRVKDILINSKFSSEDIFDEYERFIFGVEKIDNIRKIMSKNKELENISRKAETLYKSYIKSKLVKMENEILTKLEDKEDIESLVSEVKARYKSLKSRVDSSDIKDLEKILVVAEGEKEQFILSADGKTKRRERVTLRKVKVNSKFNIENESEAEEYIRELEIKLNELKKEILKSLNENKIVDID